MASEQEQKRKADAADGEEAAAKRPRIEPNGVPAAGAGAPAAAAPRRLGIDMEKLQKAKAALQKQKELRERMAKAGITLGGLGAAAAAPRPPPAGPGGPVPPLAPVPPPGAAGVPLPAPHMSQLIAASLTAAALGVPRPATKLPPPLILDDQGRELDAEGKVIERAPPRVQQSQAAIEQQEQRRREEEAAKYFDPGLGNAALERLQRRPRASFQFVEEGKLQKQAEVGRLRARYGDGAAKQMQQRKKQEAEAAATGGDANLIPLGTRPQLEAAPAQVEAPIPEVEWWDARILADKSSYGGVIDGEPAQINPDRITIYVEHPVMKEPPAEAPPPPPQPLKLTKRETKKLRTQRRIAREKEKQELIRQGLLEPPKPKVKISNLMRVLGEEATADPTAIEQEVRKQMAERSAAHEDRNLARMLTPAERRDKKLKKLIGEEGVETHVALYKIGDLSNNQLRFKVDVNARENHMTGACLVVTDGFSIVMVEGSPKTLRRYEKLMLRRVDWNQGREEEEEDQEGGKACKPPNYCRLVWQGVVKAPHFRKFKSDTVHSEAAARKFLADKGVEHYWDLAAAFQTDQ